MVYKPLTAPGFAEVRAILGQVSRARFDRLSMSELFARQSQDSLSLSSSKATR